MAKLNLDVRYNRKGTDCVKWDHMDFVDARVSDDALPLWLSDMEFKVADEITQALTKRIEHGFLGHSMPGDSYFEAVQGWYERRFNWKIDKESIFYSPGVLPALGFVLRGFTEEGDGIIIQEPVFYPFAELIEGTGRKIVNNQLINNKGEYSIDFEDLEHKLKEPRNTMLLLCSPHNPVGRVWSRDELERIVELCRENDVLIFSDELHCDATRAGVTHYPTMNLIYGSTVILLMIFLPMGLGGLAESMLKKIKRLRKNAAAQNVR